jgi:hypothetical protein
MIGSNSHSKKMCKEKRKKVSVVEILVQEPRFIKLGCLQRALSPNKKIMAGCSL